MFGLVTAGLDSCAEDESCNPIGCFGDFVWDGEPSAGVLEGGQYVLRMTLDDSVHVSTCEIDDPTAGGVSYCRRPELISGPGYDGLDGPHLYGNDGELPSGVTFWATDGTHGPASVTVSLEHDGELIGSWTYDGLVYDRWNEPGTCGPCFDGIHRLETW